MQSRHVEVSTCEQTIQSSAFLEEARMLPPQATQELSMKEDIGRAMVRISMPLSTIALDQLHRNGAIGVKRVVDEDVLEPSRTLPPFGSSRRARTP